jgi:hypothetical protein
MQTDFGERGFCPSPKPSCSKQVSGRSIANPPARFGPLRFVQRVPLWGAFGW